VAAKNKTKTGKEDNLLPENDTIGEKEAKEDRKPANLCSNCANLETWQSRPHSVRQEACSVKKILSPKETQCTAYRLIGEHSTDYLCRNCKHLETWASSGKEVSSEVCSLRHIILPSKQVCEHHILRAKKSSQGKPYVTHNV